MNFHNTFICNSPKLETTQLSVVSRWVNEEIVGYPYNGILLTNEKEWSVNKLRDVDESQYNTLNEKNPDKKSTYLCI